MAGTPSIPDTLDPRAAFAAVPLWYHTLELGDGVVTPGWFDLRPVVESLPWPDVEGKRCLDVGPWDGFFSFELERRGAAEVIALDIGDHSQWDWSAEARAQGPEVLREMAGPEVGAGFRAAREALGSRVERIESNVYDLSEATAGRFDVVVCGTLMLHLRDPVRALEAIRSVCDGHFMSCEQIRLGLSLRQRKRPLAEFELGENCQWWVPNQAGHHGLVASAGFDIEETRPIYAVPLGEQHPSHDRPLHSFAQRLVTRVVAGRVGVPHSALLAKPRF